MSDVVDFINHYKKSIEKHSEDRERVSKHPENLRPSKICTLIRKFIGKRERDTFEWNFSDEEEMKENFHTFMQF